jgi:UrcA family protein
MKRFNKIVYMAACFILTSGLSTYAAERNGAQVTVSYGDLNLAHEADARILLTRVSRAASRVCGGEPGIANLHEQVVHDACVKASMDRAVASVGAPLVSDLYQPGTRIRIAAD